MSESAGYQSQHHPASWRDPSGFVFLQANQVYRQVNKNYQRHYDYLISSGLYDALVKKGWLLPHTEVPPEEFTTTAETYKILHPEQLSFISYPCEWSFSMLKEAALLTIRIAKEALQKGMILKDATPFNVQWHKGKLVFIDTLSFEIYEEGKPWIAYRQFCENFTGPLLLMHYNKMPLHELQFAWPDGIPLSFVQKSLPWRSQWNMLTYLHIHLHAKFAGRHKGADERKAVVSRTKLNNLLQSLEALTEKSNLESATTWSHYYEEAATRDDYLERKKALISNWLDRFTDLKTGIDFGANQGQFAYLLAAKDINTIAADADAGAIDSLYRKINTEGITNLQPLVIDLANPSPASGLNNTERSSFLLRVQNRDIGLGLALIHHLCLGRNIPFTALASLFAGACKYLIIEFVPMSDEKSQQLLLNKKNNYHWYTEDQFRDTFSHVFHITERAPIPGTERVLYLMERIS